MKQITLVSLLFLVLLPTKNIRAQETLPVPANRRPILVDDVRTNLLQKALQQEIASNLTSDQQNKIKEYEMEKQKQLLQLKNLLGEKRARLNTLETSDKPDMKTINATIDEIAKLQAEKMKAEAACKQKIRAALNEEQRLEFDRKQQQQ